MLFQNDPFRELDALTGRVTGRSGGSNVMAMDAYRRDQDLWVHIDVPGVSPDSLDINVERNVLTISAERNWPDHEGDRTYLAERTRGKFRRQVHLGDGLDGEAIEANLDDGVLTLRIPVAERAKPRKISVSTGGTTAIEAESTPA
ncbi:MAG: Hsp20/alpha crystallin family protein [Acidimicrobiales bacterium]